MKVRVVWIVWEFFFFMVEGMLVGYIVNLKGRDVVLEGF